MEGRWLTFGRGMRKRRDVIPILEVKRSEEPLVKNVILRLGSRLCDLRKV